MRCPAPPKPTTTMTQPRTPNPDNQVDYGDFTQYQVRCLVAEYCKEVTLGLTGWGVAFKDWVELKGIAKHDGMFRLVSLANAKHQARVLPSPECSCSVPVATLQAWALDISQGDNSPRWEIEKLLTDAGHEIRDRSV